MFQIVSELYASQMFKLPRTESTANCCWRIISGLWLWCGRQYSLQAWIHDGHTKIVSITSTNGEFNEKKTLQNSRSSNNIELYSKITSFIFKDVERKHSARHWSCCFIFQSITHFYVKMPSKGSTGKLIRPLSNICSFCCSSGTENSMKEEYVSFCV
jgi:hypothetical protein